MLCTLYFLSFAHPSGRAWFWCVVDVSTGILNGKVEVGPVLDMKLYGRLQV